VHVWLSLCSRCFVLFCFVWLFVVWLFVVWLFVVCLFVVCLFVFVWVFVVGWLVGLVKLGEYGSSVGCGGV